MYVWVKACRNHGEPKHMLMGVDSHWWVAGLGLCGCLVVCRLTKSVSFKVLKTCIVDFF